MQTVPLPATGRLAPPPPSMMPGYGPPMMHPAYGPGPMTPMLPHGMMMMPHGPHLPLPLGMSPAYLPGGPLPGCGHPPPSVLHPGMTAPPGTPMMQGPYINPGSVPPPPPTPNSMSVPPQSMQSGGYASGRSTPCVTPAITQLRSPSRAMMTARSAAQQQASLQRVSDWGAYPNYSPTPSATPSIMSCAPSTMNASVVSGLESNLTELRPVSCGLASASTSGGPSPTGQIENIVPETIKNMLDSAESLRTNPSIRFEVANNFRQYLGFQKGAIPDAVVCRKLLQRFVETVLDEANTPHNTISRYLFFSINKLMESRPETKQIVVETCSLYPEGFQLFVRAVQDVSSFSAYGVLNKLVLDLDPNNNMWQALSTTAHLPKLMQTLSDIYAGSAAWLVRYLLKARPDLKSAISEGDLEHLLIGVPDIKKPGCKKESALSKMYKEQNYSCLVNILNILLILCEHSTPGQNFATLIAKHAIKDLLQCCPPRIARPSVLKLALNVLCYVAPYVENLQSKQDILNVAIQHAQAATDISTEHFTIAIIDAIIIRDQNLQAHLFKFGYVNHTCKLIVKYGTHEMLSNSKILRTITEILEYAMLDLLRMFKLFGPNDIDAMWSSVPIFYHESVAKAFLNILIEAPFYLKARAASTILAAIPLLQDRPFEKSILTAFDGIRRENIVAALFTTTQEAFNIFMRGTGNKDVYNFIRSAFELLLEVTQHELPRTQLLNLLKNGDRSFPHQILVDSTFRVIDVTDPAAKYRGTMAILTLVERLLQVDAELHSIWSTYFTTYEDMEKGHDDSSIRMKAETILSYLQGTQSDDCVDPFARIQYL